MQQRVGSQKWCRLSFLYRIISLEPLNISAEIYHNFGEKVAFIITDSPRFFKISISCLLCYNNFFHILCLSTLTFPFLLLVTLSVPNTCRIFICGHHCQHSDLLIPTKPIVLSTSELNFLSPSPLGCLYASPEFLLFLSDVA